MFNSKMKFKCKLKLTKQLSLHVKVSLIKPHVLNGKKQWRTLACPLIIITLPDVIRSQMNTVHYVM